MIGHGILSWICVIYYAVKRQENFRGEEIGKGKSTGLKTGHYNCGDKCAAHMAVPSGFTGGEMNTRDFRRIALSMEGAEESSHMGNPDFRVGGRIFATLASAKQGYGNLMLTLEQQAAFVGELPEVFVPIAGGWGRMGMTHIRLAEATEDVLTGALRAAWKLRVDKNLKVGSKKREPTRETKAAERARKKR
jgi:hypothetical protein